MKLNGTPRHYMPLPQNQSDDEENVASKEQKLENVCCKSSDTSIIFSSSIQNIKNLDDPKSLPMSPLRTLAFVLSLCMCILFITAFVFLLPCKAALRSIGSIGSLSEKWSILLTNKNVTFARTSYFGRPVLLLGYTESHSQTSEGAAGVLALRESDGKQLWHQSLHSKPVFFICDAIDVNSDGVPECLIIGNEGLLTAVDPMKGVSLWYLHSHSNIPAAHDISVPSIIPDCDGDSIPDLALVYNIPDEAVVNIGIVSGGTGRVMGSLVPLPYCTTSVITHLTWERENKTDFVFYCLDTNNNGNLWYLSTQSLCDVALNRTEHIKLRKTYRIGHTEDVHLQIISSGKGSKLLLSSGCETLILFERTKTENIRMKWKQHMKGCLHSKSVTHGRFLKEKDMHLALILNTENGSEVIGLRIKDGREAWSVIPNNGTVAFILNLHRFFGEIDGILLKALTPTRINNERPLDLNKSESFYNATEDNRSENQVNKTLCQYEENYLLVKCGEKPIIKKLGVQDIWNACEGAHCWSNSCVDKGQVVAAPLGETVDLAVISTLTVLTGMQHNLQMQTLVKLLNLQKLVTLPRCTNNFS